MCFRMARAVSLAFVTTVDMTSKCFATLHGCFGYTELDENFPGGLVGVWADVVN